MQHAHVLNEIHRDAWRCQHGDVSAPGGRDFLFSFDIDAQGQAVVQTRAMMESAPIRQGEAYLFSCRFAPIRRSGKKVILVPMIHFEPWLADLLARNGLSLLRLDRATPMHMPLGRAGHLKSDSGPTIGTVKARFVARAVDLQTATHAYQCGIGRHKSWGCGMLCIEQGEP